MQKSCSPASAEASVLKVSALAPQPELGGSRGVLTIRDATFLCTTPSTPTSSPPKHQRLLKARTAASSAQGREEEGACFGLFFPQKTL